MTGSAAVPDDPRWDAWRARVVAALDSLRPDGFLVTRGPAREIDPGPGILGRRRKPVWVRAEVSVLPMEKEGFLFVQSVHSDPGPKDFPVDAYARRAMQAAGWKAPEHPGYFSLAEDLFTAQLPWGDAKGVADLAARTYPILGVTDPEQVEIEIP